MEMVAMVATELILNTFDMSKLQDHTWGHDFTLNKFGMSKYGVGGHGGPGLLPEQVWHVKVAGPWSWWTWWPLTSP